MAERKPKWQSLPLPAVGSRWDDARPTAFGADPFRTARVMAVVEGYVMARYAGRSPFLTHMNEWHDRFKLKRKSPENRANLVAKIPGS